MHPHALRHSWASIMAVKGVHRNTLLELGGWRSSVCLDEIYCHISEDHTMEVMATHGLQFKPGPAVDCRK